MKKYVYVICMAMMVLCTFSVKSKNYFKEGTHWIVESTCCDPSIDHVFKTDYYIDGSETINEKDYLKLWNQTDSDAPKFVDYIRTDGDKVYLYYPFDQQDYLIYDFGLSEGDTEDIYLAFPTYYDNVNIHAFQLSCKGKSFSSFWNEEIILIEGYCKINDDYTESLTSQFWIDGIGNLGDPMENFTGIYVGNESSLKEVIADGKVIFNSNSADIDIIPGSVGNCDKSIYYNLSGFPNTRPQSGINIVTGKKVIL